MKLLFALSLVPLLTAGSSVTSQVASLTVGRPVIIETATDLDPETAWTPVFTNTAPLWFTNSAAATDRQRFYRTVFR